MTVDTCPMCGLALTDEPASCPRCGARLSHDAAGAGKESRREAGLASPYGDGRPARPLAGPTGREAGTRWERYEIPWFDVPEGFRAIAHPGSYDPDTRRLTAAKYGGRSVVLSVVGLLLGLAPMLFLASLLPGVLGVFWGAVALRLGSKRDRQWLAVLGFILGGWVCYSWVMSVLINL